MTKKMKPSELAERLVGGKLSEMANYSDLFGKTRDPILLLDADTRAILEPNPSAVALFGSNGGLENWCTPESLAKLAKNLSGENPFDLHLKTPSGERVFEATASVLQLADYCDVIQLITRDVTAERTARRELLEANRRLEHLATTDELTSLFNVRHFREALRLEHERSARYKKPYAVILGDIDHFKNYNDKNGHIAGDGALQLAAALLKSRARESDVVARYGGEEFVVLCPEVNAEQACVLAEALRKNLEQAHFAHGEKQPMGRVTMSLGVASFPAHGTEPGEIVKHADDALYASKGAGRNRVTRFESGMTGEKKKSA
jgi:diguanylate cyclase (GGDEF)-like protein